MSLITTPLVMLVAVFVAAASVRAIMRLASQLATPKVGTTLAVVVVLLMVVSEVIPSWIAQSIARAPLAESPAMRASSLMLVGNETARSAGAQLVNYPSLQFTEGEIRPEMRSLMNAPPWDALPIGIIRFSQPREVAGGEICRPGEIERTSTEPTQPRPRVYCVQWEARSEWGAAYVLGKETRAEWRGPWHATISSEWLERRVDRARFNELRNVHVTGGILWWIAHGIEALIGLNSPPVPLGGRAATADLLIHLAPRSGMRATGRYLYEGMR